MTRIQHYTFCIRPAVALVLFASIGIVAGCARPSPPAPPKKVLDVTYVTPLINPDMLKDEYFTGRTEPFKYVEIRPQVTGELKRVCFKDGDTVREGTLLFEIDERMYVAQQLNSIAAIAKAKAIQLQTEADLKRAQASYDKGVGAEADLDAAKANRDAAKASVAAAEAALKLAELNVEWTKISAQYPGRLSMRRVDPGNIVTANTTLLTTLIELDKMYIGFDIDEQTLERRREAIRDGEIPTANEAKLEVKVGLGHKEGFPFTATVIFSENQLDPGTGTLHIRAVMDNPPLRSGLSAVTGMAAALDSERKGLRMLSPNMFVRVRLPLGKPYEALLVREEAIGSDQGHKFVYVINQKTNIIEKRRVKVGPIWRSDDPTDTRIFRTIEERTAKNPKAEGVARGEWIVFGGQQRIKENEEVKPKEEKQEPLKKETPNGN
jgi:RND family efflux transporter MFP subunit